MTFFIIKRAERDQIAAIFYGSDSGSRWDDLTWMIVGVALRGHPNRSLLFRTGVATEGRPNNHPRLVNLFTAAI